MQISPINSNYQNNNTNFKGTVDKSVVRYLKEFQQDAIRRKGPSKWKTADIEHLTTKLPVILQQLKDFMAKLHPDTKLTVEKRCSWKDWCLYNTKLKTNTLADPENSSEFIHSFQAKRDHVTCAKQWHDIREFKKVEGYVEDFVKQDPKELDKHIFDSYISSIAYDATQGGLFKEFSINKRIKKAHDCSKEFGVENVNLEKINSNLNKYNDEMDAYMRRELLRRQVKKDLKDVKLK